MSFSDPDPLEEDMSVMCEDMTPDQLIAYLKSYHQAFGLILKVQGHQELAVFRHLKKVYGRDAGLIVKWTTYHYKGFFRGEPITFNSFSKGRKWFTDKMHLEVQQELRKENSRTYTATGGSLGGRGLADL